ncbi:MAG: hypothetical protein ABT24_14875 [Thiomonas sp. SCN 64-16]|nr:MAG: hypothetical protein ABT24_14875 [Thiomonas sp. SCN 64-16]
MIDPGLDQARCIAALSGVLHQRALPQGEKAGTPQRCLRRHHRHRQQMRCAPDAAAHPAPALPSAQRHDDQTGHVEHNHAQMHRENEVRQLQVE